MFGAPYFGNIPNSDSPYIQSPVISRPPTLKPVHTLPPRSLLPPMMPFGSGPSLMTANPPPVEKPPVTTVFVGNISDKAPDHMIKQLLNKCGNVLSWKRVHGASGKLQAFGFCEYEDPESTLRCIRLLHGWTIAEKELVVKVDPKTKAQLDEYKIKKKVAAVKKEGAAAVDVDTKDSEENEELDEATIAADNAVKALLKGIMEDYAEELKKGPEEEEVIEDPKVIETRRRERLEGPKHLTIDDMDLDNERKDLINREIETFRNRHKDVDMDRTHREEEMRRKYQERERREKDRLRRGGGGGGGCEAPSPPPRDIASPSHGSGGHSTRGGSSSRYSSSQNHKESSGRSRSPAPSLSRNRHSNSKSRHRDLDNMNDSRGGGGGSLPNEDIEESMARKQMERKIMLKEAAYVDRLKKWNSRETQQARLYEREYKKQKEMKRERETESKRLLAFFEKYDDDKDDSKYYKGSSLQRRMRVRKSEEKSDEQDRHMESEEIEKLREKLLAENNPEVEAIILRAEQAMHEHLKKRLALLDFEELPIVETEEAEGVDEEENESNLPSPQSQPSRSNSPLKREVSTPNESMETAAFVTNSSSTLSSSHTAAASDHQSTSSFHRESDVEKEKNHRGNKVVVKQESEVDIRALNNIYPSDVLAAAQRGDADAKKYIMKAIVERIPTEKAELFTYPIQWSLVDNEFMNVRIRPWVDKKINAYVGEDVPSLSTFLCEQVMKHESPYDIIKDISMILEDEAEVFVVKMYRLLIYQIEAKTTGIDG